MNDTATARTRTRGGGAILAFVFALLLSFGVCVPTIQQAWADETTINVDVLTQSEDNTVLCYNKGLEVSSQAAETYGFVEPEGIANSGKVTTLDALVTFHKGFYEGFADKPGDFLVVSNGSITKIFGVETMSCGFLVNGKCPKYPDQEDTGSLIHDSVIKNGDRLNFFRTHGQYYGMMEPVLFFNSDAYSVNQGSVLELEVTKGYAFAGMGMPEDIVEAEDAVVGIYDTNGNLVDAAVVDEDGVATFTETADYAAGDYYIAISEYEDDYGDTSFVSAYATLTVSVAPVPEALQLSKLEFRSGSSATSALRTLEPAFDPAVKNYTLVVPSNNVSSAGYAWATLAEGASGDITIEYPHASSGTLQTKNVTSGASSGVSLANSLTSNSVNGNTLTVKVGGEEAYVINVVREVQINTLKFASGGSALTLSPAYAMATKEYSLVLPTDAQLDITPTISNATLAGASTITIAGQQATSGQATQVVPAWSDRSYDLMVQVSAEGAADTIYTIHCTEQPSELAIETAPTKTAYDPGETFDPAGMTLKATFADGGEKIVGPDEFTFSPAGALKMADSTITVSYGGLTATQPITINAPFEGKGTQEDPFLIATADDYDTIRSIVASGDTLENVYLKQTADITLNSDWTSIGAAPAKLFSGNLDGDNHLLTVPYDCPPLIRFMKYGGVSNLNIYGERINGAGLIDGANVTGDQNPTYTLDNITVKSGSNIVKSGLTDVTPPVNGYGAISGGHTATIKNCTIEQGVTVGCDGDRSMVGGIAGYLQGTIENCVCNATVKGVNYVGGIMGTVGNAMGTKMVTGCSFGGSVVATGDHAGGIIGGDFYNNSAPNGIHANVVSNTVTGSVTGADKVGGIMGGSSFIAQAWNPYEFKGNNFLGTVTATAEEADAVGGTIGFCRSLNKFDDISGNYFIAGCGAVKGIGKAEYVDTNCATHETESDALYFNTENDTTGCPSVQWCSWKKAHNRTDDPLGADAAALATSDTSTNPAYNAMALIAAIGEVTLDSGDAISAAREAYDALTETQQAAVGNYGVLTAAEAEYAQLVESAELINNAIALIDAIGDVTLDSGDAISAAREAYNALSDEQRAQVGNYGVLTAAEAAYANLKVDEQGQIIDQQQQTIDEQGQTIADQQQAIAALQLAVEKLQYEIAFVNVDPAATASYTAPAKDGCTVTVSWTPDAQVDGYQVVCAGAPAYVADAATYTYEGLTAGTEYRVDVQAYVEASDGAKVLVGKVSSVATTPMMAQTITAKNVSKTNYKASTLKKKALYFYVSGGVKVTCPTGGTTGAITYSKYSGSSKLSVTKAGKVTVKKGTAKGTYKMKVKIHAAGSADCKAVNKYITVTVKVK